MTMYESDIWLMPNWRRWLIGIKYEEFSTHINTLCIKWNRIPDPTSEERSVAKVPVEGRRYLASHWLGRLILRRLFKINHAGPSALTQEGSCLEIYPLPPEEKYKDIP